MFLCYRAFNLRDRLISRDITFDIYSVLEVQHRACSIYIQLSLRVQPLTVALEDATNLLYSVCRWRAAVRNDTRAPQYSMRNIHSVSLTTPTNLQGAFRDCNITSRIAGSMFQRSWGRSRVNSSDILTTRNSPGRLYLG